MSSLSLNLVCPSVSSSLAPRRLLNKSYRSCFFSAFLRECIISCIYFCGEMRAAINIHVSRCGEWRVARLRTDLEIVICDPEIANTLGRPQLEHPTRKDYLHPEVV